MDIDMKITDRQDLLIERILIEGALIPSESGQLVANPKIREFVKLLTHKASTAQGDEVLPQTGRR